MNKARGFTLVELVIVLVVMGVIATGIAKVVTSSMSVFVGVYLKDHHFQSQIFLYFFLFFYFGCVYVIKFIWYNGKGLTLFW